MLFHSLFVFPPISILEKFYKQKFATNSPVRADCGKEVITAAEIESKSGKEK